MAQVLALGFLLIGSIFIFLAGVGILRMPDLFTRMHSITKSATLGIGCMMVGLAIFFNDLGITTRALMVIILVFISVPVGSHLIGRSAYFSRVPLWEGTLSDDLRGHYNRVTHELRGMEGEGDDPDGFENGLENDFTNGDEDQ